MQGAGAKLCKQSRHRRMVLGASQLHRDGRTLQRDGRQDVQMKWVQGPSPQSRESAVPREAQEVGVTIGHRKGNVWSAGRDQDVESECRGRVPP